MWKKVVAIVLLLAVIGVAVYKLFVAKTDVNSLVEKINTSMESYHLEGKMEMRNGEEERNYIVKVSYQKDNDKDYFKVSMFDTGINQEQLILRNDKGVYVMTPSLNQVYEFKGDWPNNSPKPYLYQSMLGIFSDEYELQKLDDGYVVTSYPKFANSNQWKKQEIKFTDSLEPVWVCIYGENNDLKVKFTITKFEDSASFDDKYFALEDNYTNAKENASNVTATIDDLPLFPANVLLSAELKDQTTATINGNVVHILSYDGTSPFTIVQKVLPVSDEMNVSVLKGELVDLTTGVGFYDNQSLSYCYNGVEYRIYSEVLNVAQLIEVANGMEVVVTK